MDEINTKDTIATATEYVASVTPSVICLALALGVKPAAFAKILVDRDGDSFGDYLAELTAAYTKESLAHARAKRDEDKAKKAK